MIGWYGPCWMAPRSARSYHREPSAAGRAIVAWHHSFLRVSRREARDLPRSSLGFRVSSPSL